MPSQNFFSASSPFSAWCIQPLDAVTPADFVALRGIAPEFYTGLLHSAAAAELTVAQRAGLVNSTAEWSLLLLAPNPDEQIDLTGFSVGDQQFLSRLDKAFASASVVEKPVCPVSALALPFASGWQLYLGYELAGEVEPVLAEQLLLDQHVVAQARRVRGALLFNHRLEMAWVCLEQREAGQLERIHRDLAAAKSMAVQADTVKSQAHDAQIAEDSPDHFVDAVTRTLAYIRDGDVFQTNLSRAWQLQLTEPVASLALYRQLSSINPAPFAAWFEVADAVDSADAGHNNGFELISSSPERLLAISGLDEQQQRLIQMRPIAGTRPRDSEQGTNQRLLDELQSSPKENAEHLMLIDLARNDLGRVCLPGSVKVDELMCIESFAHVHHIVSNVSGQIDVEITPGEAIAAVFPGGTITGCPKVRCMEIIAELEQCARGAYTGAVGYLGLDGQLDLNIVIRSLVRPSQQQSQLTLRAGAGIVADSDPLHELAETRAKAASVLRAFKELTE